jgi:ribulose-5-phosphate 4-epimerase/fuculose-1-phosphate aldolase
VEIVYTGYKEFIYTDNDLSNFYTNPSSLAAKFIENEYLLISDMDGKVVDKYCF